MNTVAVDVDGTIFPHRSVEPIPAARKMLEDLKAAGFRIILHTCRYSEDTQMFLHQELADQMNHNGLPFDDIWTGAGKPYADFYIDDRAIHVEEVRPFTYMAAVPWMIAQLKKEERWYGPES